MGVKVAFLRHAPTSWNLEHRFQGSRDIPLLESSIQSLQKKCIPQQFAEFRTFTSPLKRSVQTAKALGLDDFVQESRLRECNFGDWEGLTKEEVKKSHPDYFAMADYHGLNTRIHNGESIRQVQERVFSWIQNLSENSLAISHKSLITAVYALATDWQILSPPKDKLDFKHNIHVFNYQAGKLSVFDLNIPLSTRD